ncbi:MAG: single-stranded-DNA-specific exonuclease RecJ, partial [Bacteroidota bacterium]
HVTSDFHKIIRQFAPFGPANHNPIFVSKQVEAFGPIELLREEHIRLQVVQYGSAPIHAIAFGMRNYYEQFSQNQQFTIAYSIEENHWGGKTKLQLMIKDIDFTGQKWS